MNWNSGKYKELRNRTYFVLVSFISQLPWRIQWWTSLLPNNFSGIALLPDVKGVAKLKRWQIQRTNRWNAGVWECVETKHFMWVSWRRPTSAVLGWWLEKATTLLTNRPPNPSVNGESKKENLHKGQCIRFYCATFFFFFVELKQKLL